MNYDAEPGLSRSVIAELRAYDKERETAPNPHKLWGEDRVKLYRLNIAPGEDECEGEDWDEWFTSLRDAKARRKELIDLDPTMAGHRYGRDFRIERVKLSNCSRQELVLRVLNRRGYVVVSEVVVEDYIPLEHTREDECAIPGERDEI